MPTTLLLAHPDFQNFLRHCIGIVCRPACLPTWLLTAFCLQAPRTSFEAPRYCWMDKRSCSVKISNRKFGRPMHSAEHFIWLPNMYIGTYLCMYHKNIVPKLSYTFRVSLFLTHAFSCFRKLCFVEKCISSHASRMSRFYKFLGGIYAFYIVIHFVYQFSSRIVALVCSSFAND